MQLGLNNSEVQKMNRCLILKLMLEKGGITRTELSSCTGLQKATITNIMNEFINMGIVVDASGNPAETARRGDTLRLDLEGMYILSVSINRKDYKVYLYTLDGKLKLENEKGISRKADIHKTLDALKGDIRKVVGQIGKERIVGACLGMPGPYIKKETEVALVSGFEQLAGVDVRKELEQEFGMPFLSEHDAKLSAFAEWKNLGDIKEKNHISLVALRSTGVGIGAGIIIGGRIVEGKLGIAGEIGHMGINYNQKRKGTSHKGVLEQHAGTEIAVKYVGERLYEFPDSILNEESGYGEIVKAYQEGDSLAEYAIHKLAWMMGYGLAGIVYLLNPDYIILGRDYPESEAFLDQVRKSMGEFVHPMIMESVSIRTSAVTEDSIMLGGYYFAVEHLLEHNLLLDCIKRVKDKEEETG